MKFPFMLACILGSAIFTSRIASGMILESPLFDQQYIAGYFLQNHSNEPIHLRGSFQEKNNAETDFAVLHLQPGPILREQTSNLANGITSTNADVICIQEIFADNAYDLYEALHSNYAHFVYVCPYHIGGLLIASKYPIEKIQFNKFQIGVSQEGFFDFIVKNGSTLLGHIYVASLQEDSLEAIHSLKFTQIIEKMQNDVLTMEENSAPFFLCGNLEALRHSQESKILLDTYFYENNHTDTASALLLCSLPAFPNEVVSPEHTILTASVNMKDDHFGLLTVIRKDNPCSIDSILKNIGGYWNENTIILCGGSVEVSAGSDTNGNSSLEASISTSTQTDSGDTFSAEVSGGVYQDREGNTSGEVKGTFSWSW